MTHTQEGFVKEALLANVGVKALQLGKRALKPLAKKFKFARTGSKKMTAGINKLKKTKSFESSAQRADWSKTKENLFRKNAPKFKDLKLYQKARIAGGIGMNVSLGAVPAGAAIYAGAKKLSGKPDYEGKYKNLQKQVQAKQQAEKLYYG